MNSIKIRRKTDYPPLASVRPLDQLRERIRYKHYSLSTEKIYVYGMRAFVHFHKLRHPRAMGKPEVEAFLIGLVAERQVSASTHWQALSALLFLYGEVLSVELPWLDEVGRPWQVVLGHADVKTTMIYTHVLKVGGAGVRSPLDVL